MKLQDLPAGALVFIGGGVGASLRALVGAFAPGNASVLIVNFLGALTLGAVTGYLAQKNSGGAQNLLKFGLGTGLCGGFTTYSSFSLATLGYLQDGQPAAALAYSGGMLIGGVTFCWLGFLLAEKIGAKVRGAGA